MWNSYRSDPAFEGLASHLRALVAPVGVVIGQLRDLLGHVAHHLAAHCSLDGAFERGELAFGGGEVAADRLPVPLCLVLAGTVDQQRVEEDYIALLHLKIEPLSLDLVVLGDPEVGLVHLAVPVGIAVFVELPLMRKWQDVQPSVLFGAVL